MPFTKAGEHTCCSQACFLRNISKVTVAVSDRSLLAFGGGGNVFLGKALCGWPGLSPEGLHSPRPMSGPCSLTARTSSLGGGPTNARVGGQASKAGQRCCKIPKHTTPRRSGKRSLPSPPPSPSSPVRKRVCQAEPPQQNSSPQPVRALRAPSWERLKL